MQYESLTVVTSVFFWRYLMMKRTLTRSLLVGFAFTVLMGSPTVYAQVADAEPSTIEERLTANPNDTQVLNEYMMAQLRQLLPKINTSPDDAQEILDSMKVTLGALEPTTDEAKQLLGRARDAIGFYEDQLELARVTPDELKDRLNENPDDASLLSMFVQKSIQQVAPLTSSDPAQAEQMLAAAEAFLEGLREKIESEEGKQALAAKDRPFDQLRNAIERTKRLNAIVGSEAAPLNIKDWVNGSPLTDEDLQGKVVLLDFWAVWCGPCIVTFPHLREWHEQYADKGLVIIGITNYYNFVWDEASQRATRSAEKVSPEQEQEMLVKFAEHHNLEHRFAIAEDGSLAEFYGVSGIPHAVVIDRKGKVQLMRVGSGDAAAKDIEQAIKQAIAESGEA